MYEEIRTKKGACLMASLEQLPTDMHGPMVANSSTHVACVEDACVPLPSNSPASFLCLK